MLAGKRSARVGDQIQKEVSILLLERVKDPRVKGVTVTGIRLSDDLKMARIYYSVMGSKDQVESAQAGLDSAKGFIKRQMADIKKMEDIEKIRIPKAIDFSKISGLSREIVEKLNEVRPFSLGQASRISGVTPAAIMLLMVYFKKYRA